MFLPFCQVYLNKKVVSTVCKTLLLDGMTSPIKRFVVATPSRKINYRDTSPGAKGFPPPILAIEEAPCYQLYQDHHVRGRTALAVYPRGKLLCQEALFTFQEAFWRRFEP